MFFIINDLKECISALKLKFDDQKELVKLVKNNSFNGFSSTIIFQLKSENHKKIADSIVEWFLKNKKDNYQNVFIANNNFINFQISYQKYLEYLIKTPCFTKKNIKILIESVSANPTGRIHLGHVRIAFFGDVLNNLAKLLGYTTVCEYWVNDYGQQARVFSFSVYQSLQLKKNIAIQQHPDGYSGIVIDKIASEIENFPVDNLNFEEFCKTSFLDHFLVNCTQKVLSLIKSDLNKIHVFIDSWKFEGEIVKKTNFNDLLEQLKPNSYFYQDNALWLKTTLYGDDKDRVLIRSDKRASYFGTDVAYHLEKLQRGFDILFNVWGTDHEGHIKRMYCAFDALKNTTKTSLKIFALQLVTLYKNKELVRLSKRAGNVITIETMLSMISEDAARWFMLSQNNGTIIKIDLDIANLQNSANPVYYVQYAFARMNSILRIANSDQLKEITDCSLLINEKEISLLNQLVYYPFMLQKAMETGELHLLTNFLYETASLFHSWYKVCKINDDKNSLLSAQRLALLRSLQFIVKQILDVLKISTPQQM